MSITIHGYQNWNFYQNNPYGSTYWFSTPEARDRAREISIDEASDRGLSAPRDNFRAVKRTLDHDCGGGPDCVADEDDCCLLYGRSTDWLEQLQREGYVGKMDEMDHTWMDDGAVE